MTAELLELARSIAVEAGELAARRRSEGVRLAATKSSLVDIVTDADREVEAFVRERLAAARPDDGVLGEEGGDVRGSSGLTWVVDPIDGTVNYFYGMPRYAVSIAVVEGDPDPAGWQALAGVVAAPVLGDVYTASAGGGAQLNGEPLHVPEPPQLARALVATGFSYQSAMRAAQGEVLAGLLPRIADIRRESPASLDLGAVAAGRCDAYFEQGLNPWDHAAGTLIAREAGAVVKGWGDAAEPSRDFLIAAAPALASALEALLAELGARRAGEIPGFE